MLYSILQGERKKKDLVEEIQRQGQVDESFFISEERERERESLGYIVCRGEESLSPFSHRVKYNISTRRDCIERKKKTSVGGGWRTAALCMSHGQLRFWQSTNRLTRLSSILYISLAFLSH